MQHETESVTVDPEWDWQAAARALWGSKFMTPLAEVAGVAGRTVERWVAQDRTPPRVSDWLIATVRMVPEHQRLAYGRVIRGARATEDGREVLLQALKDLDSCRLP